jgi:RNA polymerase sigma-70 factor, ECF subfamily
MCTSHFCDLLLKNSPILPESQLIKACLRGEASAYEDLYRRYAPKMLVVCKRYVGDYEDAKDLLQEGFMKVFQELHRFRNEGSFEGWIRRIMINVSLEHYKKIVKTSHQLEDITLLNDYSQPTTDQNIESQLSAEELLLLVQALPPAYRVVFNLYVFEGFKHHEIAKQLGIGEGTSKSNLQDARRILKRKILIMNKEAKTRSI